MPTLKELKDKATEISVKQNDLLNDDRPWSEKAEEFKNYDAEVKSVMAEYEARKGVSDLENMLAGGSEEHVTQGEQRQAGTKTLGQQVVESDAFTNSVQKGARWTSGQIEIKDLTVSDPAKPGVLPATQQPGIVDILHRRLTVRDLLAAGSMDSLSITYLVEKAITNAADAVAKGDLKPESAMELDTVIESAKKIATTLTIPDETLDDLSYAASYITARLGTFVQLKEEDELLNGSGAGAHLTGLMNRAGLAPAIAKGADVAPDAVFKQITAIRTGAFLEPDGIIMNPADWQTIKLSKDANGQYYGGGPFVAGVGDVLWGLPVAVTPAIAAGTALVGAFKTAAQVLQRKGLTVEATNTNEDDFVHNRTTFRAEERLALAVYRPGAFGPVTGLAGA